MVCRFVYRERLQAMLQAVREDIYGEGNKHRKPTQSTARNLKIELLHCKRSSLSFEFTRFLHINDTQTKVKSILKPQSACMAEP